MTLTRREFGVASFAALALSKTAWAAAPLADMPAGAIDCHNHIVGPLAKYPMAANRTRVSRSTRKEIFSAPR